MNAWKTRWNVSSLIYPISDFNWAHSFLENYGLCLVAPLCLLIYVLLKLYENTAETSYLKALTDFRTLLFFSVGLLQKWLTITWLAFLAVNHGTPGRCRSFRLVLDRVPHVYSHSASPAGKNILKETCGQVSFSGFLKVCLLCVHYKTQM